MPDPIPVGPISRSLVSRRPMLTCNDHAKADRTTGGENGHTGGIPKQLENYGSIYVCDKERHAEITNDLK